MPRQRAVERGVRNAERTMPYLHHVVLHFPIALTIASAFVHTVAWIRKDDTAFALGRVLVYLAAVSALVAASSGLLSADHVVELGGDARAIARHRNAALAFTAMVVVAAGASYAWQRRSGPYLGVAAHALPVVAAGLVGLAAHFGGDMLHPGIAPWSSAAHRHGAWGQAAPSSDGGDHAPSAAAPAMDPTCEKGDPTPMPSGTHHATQSSGVAASPPPPAPTTPPADLTAAPPSRPPPPDYQSPTTPPTSTAPPAPSTGNPHQGHKM